MFIHAPLPDVLNVNVVDKKLACTLGGWGVIFRCRRKYSTNLKKKALLTRAVRPVLLFTTRHSMTDGDL